jgi:hypothetical protein
LQIPLQAFCVLGAIEMGRRLYMNRIGQYSWNLNGLYSTFW